KAMGTWLGHIASGEGREDVSTPVCIVQQSSKAVQLGYREYLQVLAIISLSLALLNLLPLLPLDGGYMGCSIVEGIRGRAVQRSVYERVSAVGIALVLLLFFVGLSNDIGAIRGGWTRRVRSARSIHVGGGQSGGGAPVVVQSMTLTKTHAVEATTAQIA